MGRQRILDRLCRPAPAGRAAWRPRRSQTRHGDRADRVHGRLAVMRRRRKPGDVGRRPLRAGCRRRALIGTHSRHDRRDVPRATPAGSGYWHLQFRGRGGRINRTARRWNPDPDAQLALGLLCQSALRSRRRDPGVKAVGVRPWDRALGGC